MRKEKRKIDLRLVETSSEFRQMNNLSKEELTEWLNKNYNRNE